MKLFRFLIKYSPATLIVAVLTGIVSGASSASLMALINRTLADVEGTSSPVIWAFAGIMLTVFLASLGSRLLLLRISTRAMVKMRMGLCRQILASPLRQVESHGAPRLMATLTEDILAVSDTLAQVPLLCINIAVIAACVTYLFWLSWPLALGFVVLFALGVVTYELIEKRTRGYLAQGREKWDELIGIYNTLIYGNKELKLHRRRRRAFISEELRPTAKTMEKLAFSWHKIFAIAAGYGQIFYFVLIGAIIFAAPRLGSFEQEVLVGFTLLTIYLSGPISLIVGLFPGFQRASVSLQKIESLGLSLSAGDHPDEEASELPLVQPFSGLEVVDLRYVYREVEEDAAFTLGPINLKLHPGEITFITGGNGSGKSSFARLLTGLYVPESGAILFNGHTVTDENRDHYRQHYSVVFSDYHLFEGLLGLLSDDLSDRVATYLERLQLTDKVKVVDGKFSTTKLSQGQRKRLALLTAFVEDRPIYLFDEWAADQDPSFKKVFYHQILPDLKAANKTVLVISHDEHFYHVADRVIKFEDGVVIGDTTADEQPRALSGSTERLAVAVGVGDPAAELLEAKVIA